MCTNVHVCPEFVQNSSAWRLEQETGHRFRGDGMGLGQTPGEHRRKAAGSPRIQTTSRFATVHHLLGDSQKVMISSVEFHHGDRA